MCSIRMKAKSRGYWWKQFIYFLSPSLDSCILGDFIPGLPHCLLQTSHHLQHRASSSLRTTFPRTPSYIIWNYSLSMKEFARGSDDKASGTSQETQVRSLGWEDPLEKEMAHHSSTLAWKIPWTEEHGRLHTVYGVSKSRTWLSDFTFIFKERNVCEIWTVGAKRKPLFQGGKSSQFLELPHTCLFLKSSGDLHSLSSSHIRIISDSYIKPLIPILLILVPFF